MTKKHGSKFDIVQLLILSLYCSKHKRSITITNMEVKFEMSGEFFTRGQKAGGEITVGIWAVVRFATQEWDDDLRELITTGEDEVDVLGCCIGGAAVRPQNINGAFYEAIKSAAIAYAVDKLDGEYIAEQVPLTPSAQPA